MVDVSVVVVAVAGILFLAVCFWFIRTEKLYGKLLYEEKLKNAQLSIANQNYKEKLSQLDYQNQHNDSISLEEVDSLPYWENEKEQYQTVDFRRREDEYEEVIFPDNPFEEFGQTLDDDLLEDFKKFTGYSPWEHPNQQKENVTSKESSKEKLDFYSSEYQTSEFPLYDDPIKQYKETHGFLPWEWEELERKEQI